MDAVRESIAAMRSGAKEVDMQGKGVGDAEAKELAKELDRNRTLSKLHLDGNSIGEEGCAALAAALQSSYCTLKALYLGGNRIGDGGCDALAAALHSRYSSLTALNLGGNKIGYGGCAALAIAIQSHDFSLAALSLGSNRIGDTGCTVLASALQSRDSSLKALYFPDNWIGDDGCAALASALQSPHCSLTTLNLGRNNISDAGCAALASALQSSHCKLTALYLYNNAIGDDGCAALARVLQSPHCTITALDVDGNTIGNRSANMLASSLEKNNSLIHIDMRENDDVAAQVYARILILVQLARERIAHVPRHLVAKLSDTFLQQVSFASYQAQIQFGGEVINASFGCIANFKPVLAALRELAGPSLPPRPSHSPASPIHTAPRLEEQRDHSLLLQKDIPDSMRLVWSDVDAIVRDNNSLGTGGTGEVFQGKLRGEDVAVKVGARSGVARRIIEDFKREVRALCNIPFHPNVMPLKYVVAEKRGIALVFPLAESLEDACYEAQERSDHVPREVLLYLYDIACGLRHIHAHGLEHRDLKPANTFVLRNTEKQSEGRKSGPGVFNDRSTRGVISDFGTAKLHAIKTTLALSTSKAQEGTVGTIPYMSPEQAARRSARTFEVTTKSDIWSYGHLANELLAGKCPYEDEDTDVATLVQSEVARGDFLPKADPSLPEALQRLVNRCFRFNPFQRPSAHEICLRLEEILQEQDKSEESVFAAYDKEEERMQEMFMQFSRKLGLDERLGDIEELQRVGNERGGAIAQGIELLAEAVRTLQQQHEQLSYVTEATRAEFCGRMEAVDARLNYAQITLLQ